MAACTVAICTRSTRGFDARSDQVIACEICEVPIHRECLPGRGDLIY